MVGYVWFLQNFRENIKRKSKNKEKKMKNKKIKLNK